MDFNKDLISKPISGINLEKFSSYFESFSDGKNNRLSLNGEWSVLRLDDFDEKVVSKDYEINDLKRIIVPSHLELNGFDRPQYVNTSTPWDGLEELSFDELPKHNPCFIYFKNLSITLQNLDYFLEFHGVEACLALFVNGEFVGYSTHNFEISKFNITKYLVNGNNRITCVVYKYSFTTRLSLQDMWRFSGIFRDVNLICLNKTHIIDIDNKSILDTNLVDGKLDVEVEISDFEDAEVAFSLYDNDKIISEKRIDVVEGIAHNFLTISDCKKWSDEVPNLYKLKIELFKNNKAIEQTEINIGFRRIDIVKGVIYLNGQRLIIKGVNRHDYNCLKGRALNKQDEEDDLILIKNNNFNAVRTCHYPDTVYFYDLCDKLGLIVMDECSIETHGTRQRLKDWEKGLPGSDPKYKEITVKRAEAMYERDKNHPCVLFWSLGNESGVGTNLEESSKYLHEVDPSRVIHYETCHDNKKFDYISDVYSRMYAKPDDIRKFLKKKKTKKPYILCEFEHSMGNSTGNFDEYMYLCDEFANFQGGFIWDYMDQGLWYNGKLCFGGDCGDFPNDDNFNANGLLLSDRKETSKLDEVKQWYAPFKIIHLDEKKVVIKSLYNFKNTANLNYFYEILENSRIIFEKQFKLNLEPKEQIEMSFPNNIEFRKGHYYIARIRVVQSVEEFGIKEGNELFFYENFIHSERNVTNEISKIERKSPLKAYWSTDHLTVENKNLKVLFSGIYSSKGGLRAIYYKNKQMMCDLVWPTLFRAITDNDRAYFKFWQYFFMRASAYPLYNALFKPFKIISQTEDEIKVEYSYKMAVLNIFNNFKIIYTIRSSDEILVEFKYTQPIFKKTPVIGLRFPIPSEKSNFTFEGLGKRDNYIDRLRGQRYGIYNSNVNEEYVPYSIPQECGNHEFSRKVMIDYDDVFFTFEAIDKTFSFKYLPYTEFQMEFANRNEELVKTKFNYLTIQAFMKGVGGDDSWGASVHKQYRNKKKRISQKFLIKFIEKN